MFHLEDLKGKLVIAPFDIQMQLLSQIKKHKQLVSIKMMTIEELCNHMFFTYRKQAIYYLMKQYHYQYDVAKMYLDNLWLIEEKIYHNKKLDWLVKLKQELKEQQLLNYDPSFLDWICSIPVVFIGDYFGLLEQKCFNKLKEYTKVMLYEIKPVDAIQTVYEFDTIEQEIVFIATDICKKIKQGISIQNIYLLNITSEYEKPLRRIFNQFHIPLPPIESSLYHSSIVRELLELWKMNDKEKIKIQIEKKTTKEEQNIINQLVTILNQYNFDQIDNYVLMCIKEECKRTKIKQRNNQNKVQITNLGTRIYTEHDFVYLIGVNQENIPKYEKNESYIDDTICHLLNIDDTLLRNRKRKNCIIKQIQQIPNGILTYKKRTAFQEYYPSTLIKEMKLKVMTIESEKCYNFSDIWNQLTLGTFMDHYTSTNQKVKDFDLLYSHYPEIPYQSYQNQYTGITKEKLYQYLNEKLVLSYTSIDHYYRCGFRYYIDHILKLSLYEETFAQSIGNLFHYFLSIAFKPVFNFEKEWEQYHKDKIYNAKEQFFYRKLKTELLFVINTIHEQNTHTKLNQEYYEQKIYKNKKKTIQVTFMGIVDKIKFMKEDETIYAAIIDYKTGMNETNLNNCIYGIGMQLPVYLYLVKQQKEFSNAKIVGLYLQKVINNEMLNDNQKNYQEMKKDVLRLEGYTIDQEEWIKKLDDTYRDSCMIKGMKIGNNGFYAYTKLLNQKKMDQLEKLVEEKIEKAIDHILRADFKINPKQVGMNLMGCEYCPYQDLCFKTEKDIIHLKEYRNLEFLGEEV